MNDRIPLSYVPYPYRIVDAIGTVNRKGTLVDKTNLTLCFEYLLLTLLSRVSRYRTVPNVLRPFKSSRYGTDGTLVTMVSSYVSYWDMLVVLYGNCIDIMYLPSVKIKLL